MNKKSRILLLLGLASAGGAHGAEENGFYVSSGIGALRLDFDDAGFRSAEGGIASGEEIGLDFDAAPLLAVRGGYNWGGWAVELELEHTLARTDFVIDRSNTEGDFTYRNVRVQGVYRSGGRLYGMGKIGLNNPDLDVDDANLKLGRSEFFAIGGGFRFTPAVSLEAEYGRSSHHTGTFMIGLRNHF